MLRSKTFELREPREAAIERLVTAGRSAGYRTNVHYTKEDVRYVVVRRPWRPSWPYWVALVACSLLVVLLIFVWTPWLFLIALVALLLAAFVLGGTQSDTATYRFAPPDADNGRYAVKAMWVGSRERPAANLLLG